MSEERSPTGRVKRKDAKNLIGKRYGLLVVTGKYPHEAGKNARWFCRCDCGNESVHYQGNLQRGVTKSCGCARVKAKAPKILNQDGYVFVLAPPGHPRAGIRNGRIREHILVMEEHLGRHLLKGEEVHHINANRQDNRIENLELWTRSHPAGARVEDHIEWAMQMLKTYKPEALVQTQ